MFLQAFLGALFAQIALTLGYVTYRQFAGRSVPTSSPGEVCEHELFLRMTHERAQKVMQIIDDQNKDPELKITLIGIYTRSILDLSLSLPSAREPGAPAQPKA